MGAGFFADHFSGQASSCEGSRRPKDRKLDTTLVKGFAVLHALSMSEEPLGISGLSEQLQIGKSNVHRLLATLGALGYVQQEPATRHYASTLKLWELGSTIARRDPLVRAAKPVMHALHEQTGEAVYMATLSGVDVLYLEKLESSRGAKAASYVGLRMPAITTASGKVLLAGQQDARAIAEDAIAALPGDLSVDLEDILAEFDEIGKRGFALSDSSWIRGVNALAVAIPNGGRPPVGSIGISVLPDRYDVEQLERLAPQLFNAAAEIAATLGVGRGA